MAIHGECSKSIISQVIQSKTAKACMTLVTSFAILALLFGFLFPVYRGLVHLCWLTILCSTFIPIAPHEPVILAYGALYPAWPVAICAGIAISATEFVNYHALTPILNLEKIKAFREKRSYQRAEHHFSRLPFLSLLFACFTPLPFIPFRVLAVTTGYSTRKFVLSVFMGRTPRFYLLALIGKTLNFPNWVYAVILIIAFSAILVRKLVKCKKESNEERRRGTNGSYLS